MKDKGITYRLSPQAGERLEELMKLVGSRSKQRFLNDAVAAYAWIIGQVAAGNTVGTTDPNAKDLQDKQKP